MGINQQLMDYAIALTHLYGLVHRDKVLEIYNMQNEEKAEPADINKIIEKTYKKLGANYVEVSGDFFVAEAILGSGTFSEQIKQRKGKPYYIPEKQELLKYKDNFYFEVTQQYEALKSYLEKNYFSRDDRMAAVISEDIQAICEIDFSLDQVYKFISISGIAFKDIEQANKLLQLVVELANNTRIWENNGHTPREIFEIFKKPHMRPLPGEPVKNKQGSGTTKGGPGKVKGGLITTKEWPGTIKVGQGTTKE